MIKPDMKNEFYLKFFLLIHAFVNKKNHSKLYKKIQEKRRPNTVLFYTFKIISAFLGVYFVITKQR